MLNKLHRLHCDKSKQDILYMVETCVLLTLTLKAPLLFTAKLSLLLFIVVEWRV